MRSTDDSRGVLTRREVLTGMGTGMAAAAITASAVAAPAPTAASKATATAPRQKSPKGGRQGPYNIVFVFTDQERYFRQLPAGYSLPGHERLRRTGVTFHNHYVPAVMCTSSRSVLVTGLQTIDNKMFENSDVPWITPLSTKIPTTGHMLRKAGYYTAYKGKWHLNKEFDSPAPTKLFTAEMESYGFADFVWPGDVLAHTLGGYKFDHMISGSAVSWLRNKGQALGEDGKPWALTVSFVNPHDIMYFNADAPGQNVQDNGHLLMHAARTPDHPMYAADWKMPVAPSLKQSFADAGRPKAHGEFDKAWAYNLGQIPLDEVRWNRFNNFYLNSLRAVDAQLVTLFNELDALGLSDRTIIVFTADHGEMGGAHGLRGKGPFAYEECIHVPFSVVHPDVQGGQDCHALTSHIDVAPTLCSMARMDTAWVGEAAGRELPGKDIGVALNNPREAGVNSLRESILFTYSGLALVDAELVKVLAEGRMQGKDMAASIKESGFKPDLRKRGNLRTAFDGRYKYTRYFAPVQHNTPATLDALYAANEPELYDLQQDPSEMRNLAAVRGQNDQLVLQMNAKLNAVIQKEMGRDDGRELPEIAGVSWGAERLEL
jgi:arylsulfatase A-like enzyme